MENNNIHQAGSDNWESQVMSSDIPVLVDFWAEWCGPCRAMNPILEELSEELSGKLKVAKVNIDEEQQLAGKFSIQSIPTLLLIKDGTIVEQLVGSLNKAKLQEKINPYL